MLGIHDDTPWPGEFLARIPNGSAWITATEELGADPANTDGKAYDTSSGSTIIARLNYGYAPNGTLPPRAEYANFAQRVRHFVQASTGCSIWLIGNETNLSAEWPQGEAITPADYAEAFVQCYNAIKSIPGKGPDQRVLVQALAPWAGPYTGQPLNWVDYKWRMLAEIEARGVIPDGIAVHINTRGYGPDDRLPQPGEASPMTLDFSWLVYRDWIQFGIPRHLWHLPLHATECNGLNYWDGAGPEQLANPSYQSGWLQAIHSDIDNWNRTASRFGMPIYQSINLYRWEWDPWAINQSAAKEAILDDVATVAGLGISVPTHGGISATLTQPTGTLIPRSILTATASSDAGQDPSPQTGFEASRAIDGNLSTWWASRNDGPSAPHWLAIDLGHELPVSGLVVRHSPTEARRARGFLVEVADSASGPWTIATMVRTSPPGEQVPAFTPVAFSEPIQTRHLRLYINDGSHLANPERARVNELEIYMPTGTEIPLVTFEPIQINNMGADPMEAWYVHYASTPIRSQPTVDAPVIGSVSQNGTISGVPVRVIETNEEWLEVRAEGLTGYISLTTISRIHPDNRISPGQGIPIGREKVNRWWGMPRDYVPPDLETIPTQYRLQGPNLVFQLRAEAVAALADMLDAALADGVDIRAGSNYRSWDTQKTLFDNAVNNSGRAQRFSAPPGHSEHQLGTAVDFSDPAGSTYLTQAFANTPQYAWMAVNAARHGWFQTYRQDNTNLTGYIPEPWHWRYLGRNQSTLMILSEVAARED